MPEEQTNVARQRIGKHLAGQRGLGLLRDQKWHQFPECGWRLESDPTHPCSHSGDADPVLQLHNPLTTACFPRKGESGKEMGPS